MIQLPRLLDAQFREVARLHPSRLSATDKLEPTSTATMGLPYGDPAVKLRDYVELFDADGSKGIYRVEGINSSNGERQTVNLSHGIVTLEDVLMPPDAFLEGSIKTMLAAVLAQQITPLWTLGEVEVPEDEAYTVNASNAIALQALINIASLTPEYSFTYDQSATPWVLHFRRRKQEPSCECRLSRNMSNVSVSFSPQEMCTRVTSELLPNGYMDADNADEWGVIARELPVEEETTPEGAVVLAEKYLEQHKNPTTSIEIEAIDLAKQTGESLDALILGRLCRVALPDWGVTYDHQIVSIYWADLMGKPQQKKLSLATRKKRAETALAQAAQAKKQASRNYRHIRETENSVLIQAEKIALLGEEINLKATKAEVDGAITRISTVEIDLDAAKAAIALKADRTEYNDLEKRVSSAEINIDGANAAIQLKADVTIVDGLGSRLSSAEISIDGLNSTIDLKADKIDLQGFVTATELETVRASVANLTSGLTTAQVLRSNWMYSTNGDFTYLSAAAFTHNGALVSQRNITMGGVTSVGKALSTGGELDLQHSHEVSVDSSGKLQLGGVTAEGEGGNFNIADTQYYKDGVSAAAAAVGFASFAASGGIITPRLTNDKTTTYFCSSGTADEDHNIPIIIAADQYGNAAKTLMNVDASGVYKSGWNECRSAMSRISNVYTISQTAPGTLYMLVSGNYTSVGSDWVKVSSYGSAYSRPAEI